MSFERRRKRTFPPRFGTSLSRYRHPKVIRVRIGPFSRHRDPKRDIRALYANERRARGMPGGSGVVKQRNRQAGHFRFRSPGALAGRGAGSRSLLRSGADRGDMADVSLDELIRKRGAAIKGR